MTKPDLTRRAQPDTLPEMMDQPCTYEEMNDCLQDIARVNRLTGAYRPTLLWLEELFARIKQGSAPLQVVDVGCGYGDSLRRIHAWALKRGFAVELTGIDLNADAIRAARAATPADVPIRWVHGNAFSYEPAMGVDVVLSSLLTHHLMDSEIVSFLAWMERTVRRGWFVNDLHRMPFPYRAFGMMAKLLPFHRFVKHDGAVSIRRSFLEQDWQRLCGAADLPMDAVTIREHRPARLCVGRLKI